MKRIFEIYVWGQCPVYSDFFEFSAKMNYNPNDLEREYIVESLLLKNGMDPNTTDYEYVLQ